MTLTYHRAWLAILKGALWLCVAASWVSVALLGSLVAGLTLPSGSWVSRAAVAPLNLVFAATVPCGGDTIYAASYSEPSFKALRPGMTTTEVKATLGAPLQIFDRGDAGVTWVYSRHGAQSDDFEHRSVLFGPDGRVVEAHSCCYWD